MRIVGYVLVALLAATAMPANGNAAEPLLFPYEQQAQQHCPGDDVVWADAVLRSYNVKGERWYGRTKSGAYLCLRDAERAGYRARRAAGVAAE
jgi:hypothetical protein